MLYSCKSHKGRRLEMQNSLGLPLTPRSRGLAEIPTRLLKGKARLKICLPLVLSGEGGEPQAVAETLQSAVRHLQTCEEYFHFNQAWALAFLVHLENAEANVLIDYLFGHGHYHCMVLAVLRYDRIQESPLLKTADVIAGLTEEFWERALNYLVNRKRWSVLKAVLLHSSRPLPVSMCPQLASRSVLSEEGLDFFQTLLDRTESAHWLRTLFAAAARSGQAQEFHLFVDSNSSYIRQVIRSYCSGNNLLRQIVDPACRTRSRFRRRCHRRQISRHLDRAVSGWSDCLVVGCQAGVFHLGSSPDWKKIAVETAVSHHQHDIVRFLCGAGVVTNGILSSLAQGMPDADADNNREGWVNENQQQEAAAERRTQKLVLQKASTPGSLQDLCIHEVCRHVGWGHVKKVTVERLPLPSVIKDMLMFVGVEDLLEYTSFRQ